MDPDMLNDDDWSKLYAESLYLNRVKHLNLKMAVLSAVADIFNSNGNS